MNTLTTKSLHDYRETVKAQFAAVPLGDAAAMNTVLEAYDLTKRSERLEHALKNLQNQFNLSGGAGGAIDSVTAGTAGTGYSVGDHGVVAGGGVSATVTVATVDTAGEILTLKIDNAGVGYTTPSVTFPGSGSGTGTATATATAISKADFAAVINGVIAGL